VALVVFVSVHFSQMTLCDLRTLIQVIWIPGHPSSVGLSWPSTGIN